MGFPHSEIFGSKCAGNSPKLIAACHVLHRLSVPRHPPNALVVLDLTFVSEETILRSPLRLVPCRGRPPPRQRPCLPFLPLRLGDGARNLDFRPLPINDVKEQAGALRRYSASSDGGGRRDRTDDLLLAKQALSQLSYAPVER